MSRLVKHVDTARDARVERARRLREAFQADRHYLDDRGLVADACDVEAAVRGYHARLESGEWPVFDLPASVRTAA